MATMLSFRDLSVSLCLSLSLYIHIYIYIYIYMYQSVPSYLYHLMSRGLKQLLPPPDGPTMQHSSPSVTITIIIFMIISSPNITTMVVYCYYDYYYNQYYCYYHCRKELKRNEHAIRKRNVACKCENDTKRNSHYYYYYQLAQYYYYGCLLLFLLLLLISLLLPLLLSLLV